jgi:HlyD family secretion protein
MKLSRRTVAGGGALVVLAGGLAFWRSRPEPTRYVTAAVDRGDLADVVGATGVLQAVTTVQVGSQVSGNILSLHADFNSVVKKGQVVARLDPSLFEARLAQNKAALATAQANLDRARATLEDARQKHDRARELEAQQLVTSSDLETAKATYDGALAGVKAGEAAVQQAVANLNQAQVDLAHTVISAPIDGVVIARSVDVGQTVAASFQAPVLFQIANDLARMQVNASIDEADIGRVQAGQAVSFRVDAYPERSFPGRVEQVRLQPIVNQNVVTYNTIISVDNSDLKLMPGMTATVSVIVESRSGALRLPAAALRFRPEGFEERRASAWEGPRPSAGSAEAGERPARGPRGERGSSRAVDAGQGGPGRPGLVFVLDDAERPRPARVRVGLSDGRFVELLSGLEEGTPVLTGTEGAAAQGTAPRAGATPTPNPFAPRFQRRQR